MSSALVRVLDRWHRHGGSALERDHVTRPEAREPLRSHSPFKGHASGALQTPPGPCSSRFHTTSQHCQRCRGPGHQHRSPQGTNLNHLQTQHTSCCVLPEGEAYTVLLGRRGTVPS